MSLKPQMANKVRKFTKIKHLFDFTYFTQIHFLSIILFGAIKILLEITPKKNPLTN